MKIRKFKNCTDWFGVHALRTIPDPHEQIDRKFFLASFDQYPYDFGLGPNPREPKLTSPVSKKIASSIAENGAVFHLLNRGITVVAKGLEFDNKSERVRLQLDEVEDEKPYYGILDGGNTNAQINIWREEQEDEYPEEELKRRFVNVEVFVPRKGSTLSIPQFQDLLNDIKETRNTSVQVTNKSLSDARSHFDNMKMVLKNEKYYSQISWHEGQAGSIDALLLVMLLMIFYPRFCEDTNSVREPSHAYGHKERCLAAYLTYALNSGSKEAERVTRWIKIIPDLVQLFEELQNTIPDFYGGRFGGISEVTIFDKKPHESRKKYRKTPSKSLFFQKDMKYSFPQGWIYPIFAAFRVTVGENKSGEVQWKRDPIKFWHDHGSEICKRYEPHLQQVGFDARRIATNAICYQSMRQAVLDLYKDELLKEHGIDS